MADKGKAQAVQPQQAPAAAAAAPPRTSTGTSTWRRLLPFAMGAVAILFRYIMLQRTDETSPAGMPEIMLEREGMSEPIELDAVKRSAILKAFKSSYNAYEQHGFGHDNYHPISKHGTDLSSQGPVGYFIVDCLSSLLLMDLKDEYERAREWVATELSFEVDDKFHTFEITIRVLGGLLSAYHLSGHDALYLDKAQELADRLLPAFDTESGIPLSFVNLKRREAIADADNMGFSSVAEAGTLTLEFRYLATLTDRLDLWEKVERAMHVLGEQPTKDGLVPIFIDPTTGQYKLSEIRLGSRADSYYEYLLKAYLQTNRTEPFYRKLYDGAMLGIKSNLLQKSVAQDLVFTTELAPVPDGRGSYGMRRVPKQDHLVCFLGGSLMLGATEGRMSVPPPLEDFDDSQLDDWYMGAALVRTCVDTYARAKTGLAPEITYWHDPANVKAAQKDGRDWYINSRKRTYPDPPIDARNILRPETLESLLIAYRVSGDPIYRKWGWAIFEAFRKHCELEDGAFASIRDVDEVPVKHEDNMETFWLSESLKYLYLLFSDANLAPLDKVVFNTEAHVLPIFMP